MSFTAYKACPMSENYLGVIEQELGAEKYADLESSILQQVRENPAPYYIVFDVESSDFIEPTQFNCIYMPRDVIYAQWTVARELDEDIFWITKKK